jgi:hypothetical protein
VLVEHDIGIFNVQVHAAGCPAGRTAWRRAAMLRPRRTASHCRAWPHIDRPRMAVQYEDGVLVTGSHDGTVKVYDMLNDDLPHATI